MVSAPAPESPVDVPLPVLETDRLVLTPAAVSDLDDLLSLWRDEAFYRHIMPRALTGEEVWFRLLRDIGHWQALGHGNWMMRLKDTGQYVGSVGVLDYRRDLAAAFEGPELGWGAAPAFHGQGLAREGLSAALDWTDRVMRAPRTVCMISPDNGPSLRLAERSGYAPYARAVYKDEPVILLERLARTLAT